MQTSRADQAASAVDLVMVQEQLTGLRVGGSGPDTLITVTVGGQAPVTELQLDPAIYRRTDTAYLAGRLLAAFQDGGRRTALAARRTAPAARPVAARPVAVAARRGAVEAVGGGRVRTGADPAFDPAVDPVRALLGQERPGRELAERQKEEVR